MKNKTVYAPMMGASVALFIFCIYLLTRVEIHLNNLLEVIGSLLSVVPLLYIFFIAISYTLSYSIGIVVINIKQKYALSPRVFWLLSFSVSSLLGVIGALISYHHEHNSAKSFAIWMSVSLGGLFTSSLYSVIKEEIKG